jgi:hypothetical protein
MFKNRLGGSFPNDWQSLEFAEPVFDLTPFAVNQPVIDYFGLPAGLAKGCL